MKRRTSKPKFTIGSLLILLALFVYFKACNPDEDIFNDKVPETETPPKTRKAKKPKKEKELRYLTTFTGKVTGIKDGDTFEVLYDGQPEKVRLAEIDCPEKSQPFGNNAKQYASDLCFGKIVTVTSNGKRDRYGRIVGIITTQDNVNVNEQLVAAGLAWHYRAYSKNTNLDAIEEKARQSRVGLWADKNPVAPWDWRKSRRMK